jgi:hypothetical protein
MPKIVGPQIAEVRSNPQRRKCIIKSSCSPPLCIRVLCKSTVSWSQIVRCLPLLSTFLLSMLPSFSFLAILLFRILGLSFVFCYQSTAHPFSSRNSSHAAFNAKFGLKSSTRSGSRVKGSVGERFKCSIIEERSYDCPVLVYFSLACTRRWGL